MNLEKREKRERKKKKSKKEKKKDRVNSDSGQTVYIWKPRDAHNFQRKIIVRLGQF